MYNTVDVGSRIRYFRKLRGWSQEHLALLAGINPAFLGHLERGLKSPTVTTLDKIASALEITLAELFTDEALPEDYTKRQELERIQYTLRDLETSDIARIADIVQKIAELKG